jgi:hypothetical protein
MAIDPFYSWRSIIAVAFIALPYDPLEDRRSSR